LNIAESDFREKAKICDYIVLKNIVLGRAAKLEYAQKEKKDNTS